MAPQTLKRLPRDSGRVLLEAASLVEEHYPNCPREISQRVDLLLHLADQLHREGR